MKRNELFPRIRCSEAWECIICCQKLLIHVFCVSTFTFLLTFTILLQYKCSWNVCMFNYDKYFILLVLQCITLLSKHGISKLYVWIEYNYCQRKLIRKCNEVANIYPGIYLFAKMENEFISKKDTCISSKATH